MFEKKNSVLLIKDHGGEVVCCVWKTSDGDLVSLVQLGGSWESGRVSAKDVDNVPEYLDDLDESRIELEGTHQRLAELDQKIITSQATIRKLEERVLQMR